MLGALPGVIGTLQAMETIKLLAKFGTTLAGRMLHYDATAARMREIKLKADPACTLCGPQATITAPLAAGTPEPCGEVIPEIDVGETRRRLANGFAGILLDVRERHEYEWAHLQGSRLLPLSELPARLAELPRDESYLVYCKVGQRSAYAAALMREAGIRDVTNVQGGITAWLEHDGEVVRG